MAPLRGLLSMRAITIVPGTKGSLKLDDMPEPVRREGQVLVQTIAVGVCGTDRELIEGIYGAAPEGADRLVLGHESLGRVVEAPSGSAFAKGDMVVGIVRHPDPEPCVNCAVGEWDMCRNGRYTEHGIKGLHGFASQFFTIEEKMLVKVDKDLGSAGVLLEPATVLAKAWEHIERIGRRAKWAPRRVLVTGAGPVGLMAALMGVQRGLEVHLQDHNREGVKPALAAKIGAAYHIEPPALEFDVVIECTGAPEVIGRILAASTPDRVVCLTGLSPGSHAEGLPIAPFNQAMVLGNQVVFGSVNANHRHYEAAARALAGAEKTFLENMLTRKVPMARWHEAYDRRKGDVKTVLVFSEQDAD
jgi:threonine dehydrogenase-like Zn-dependent dehydrogenase